MPASRSTAIQLTILRQGDRNLIDLAELGSLIPRSETQVDDAFLHELAAETAHLVRSVRATGATPGALERLGALVFSHLLTEPARRRLRAAEPANLYLRLDERLVHVPWELAHDGRDFLATKFRIGRQVITSQRLPDPAPGRAPGARLRVLLVADPTETLPQAAAEAEQLCALLDAVPGVDVTLLGGRGVRRIPLLAALQEHDVVHFAGHSHYDADVPSRSGWRLAEGVLTAGELAKLRPPPALVVSNSCEAGTTAAWDGGSGYEGHAFGIGSAFLMAGVRNYVGTFWVVHDDESVLFATTFHRALASGATLGEALQLARHAVIAQRGWQSLSWASYLLYGDPGFAPLGGATAAPAPPLPREVPPAPASATRRFTVEVSASATPSEAAAVAIAAPPAVQVVGRAAELDRLEAAFARARDGTRGVMFLSGPPGIGKTTLIDAFLERAGRRGARIARGQSVEQHGAGEPYLPVLEAWAALAREADGAALRDAVRRHAPSWLAQFPVAGDAPAAAGTPGATRGRMLREMAELLEAITAERPLVLALEDLHWSDHSTLELIAYLAQRRETARLLLLGSYRPAEAKRSEHPLRGIVQELRARRSGEEIRLDPLAPNEVASYLAGRLGGAVDPELARQVHRRTDGHPLFLVNLVDYALRQDVIGEDAGRWTLRGGARALDAAVPDSLRQMIERQVESLGPDDRQALEAASIAGAEFSIAAVAAALQCDPDALDERCEGLAWTGHFLHAAGVEEWPDGTVAGRYRFVHALYRDVLAERVAESRRIRLHRRIAERKLVAYGERAGEIAGELAAHLEAAHDSGQALTYRARAGDTAVSRHADHEAIEHYSAALQLLSGLPEGSDRSQRELALLVKLATPLMSTRGYAAPEVERVFERAYALSRQVAGGPLLFPLLRGLVSFYQVRARHQNARQVGEELLALVDGRDDRVARTQAHYGHGVTLYDQVELDASEHHLLRALALYTPETHAAHVSVYGGYDPGVACRCWLAWVQWLHGFPDRALASVEEGLALARRLQHPFSVNFALLAAAMVRLYRGEAAPARRLLAEGEAIGRQEGFAYQLAMTASVEGWALLMQGRADEAAARLHAGLEGYRATGAGVARPGVLGVLAFATATAGRIDEALALIAEGVEESERTGQRLHLVQLYQARGDVLGWRGDDPASSEAEYARALDLACDFGSPALALRAATPLARLWLARGLRDKARGLLAPLVEGFREGRELRDLVDARAVLDACG